MAIINRILPMLKYWKAGIVALLVIGFAVSFHFARSRGEKLVQAEQTIEQERQKFQTQLKLIEKARQDDKERNNFRKSQAKKIKLASGGETDINASLRDAYERLRERQRDYITR